MAESFCEKHGRLSVRGTDITDKNGEAVRLYGPSTLGVVWYPEFINKEAFQTVKDWGANLVRLAMYTMEEGGYCAPDGDKEFTKELIDKGVNYCKELGMYAIIDWHILSDGDPHQNKEEAKKFFTEMSAKYKDYDNVLFEICNEPNPGGFNSGEEHEPVDWPRIKSYAMEIIPIIRANTDAIILVGTPTWSQEVDKAADDPIREYDNLMYSLHYYASTHGQDLRDKMVYALDKGLPIFVDEYSITAADGNGDINYDEADKWSALVDERKLSFAQWSLSPRNETSAMVKPNTGKVSGWSEEDLTDTGKWMLKRLKEMM